MRRSCAAEALDVGLDGGAVDLGAVAARGELGDDDPVGLAAVADLDRARRPARSASGRPRRA